MADVSRITAIWSGFPGAPGYTKFSFMPLATDADRNAAGAAVRTFFEALKAFIPNGTTIQVQPTVDNLDVVEATLSTTANMTTTPAVTTSSAVAATYPSGVGAAITWLAAGVFAGRRLKNRTYLVPLSDQYETNGTLKTAFVTAAEAAGNALIATVGADLAVWNREWTPRPASPPAGWKPEPIAGNLSSATACSVRDVVALMRSRRD